MIIRAKIWLQEWILKYSINVELRCKSLETSIGQENLTSHAPRLIITPDPGRSWSQEEDCHQLF